MAKKRYFKQLFKKNYYFAKVYYYLGFRLASLRGREPLIVYQMGKVGSTTIVDSLKASCLNKYIYHVHFLTQQGIDQAKRIYYGDNPNLLRTPYLIRSQHLLASEYLCNQLKRGLKGKKWQVITLVREPVARNVSSFFQTLDLQIPDFVEKYETNSTKIEDLIEIFLKQPDLHEFPLRWYDLEFKAALGLDVFATDFSPAKGYKIYEGQRVDVLLLKLETLNQCVQPAFRDFLGIENLTLAKTNVAEDKAYSATYQSFLNAIKLPGAYVDQMYSSKYAQHFYSEEEINGFRAKWSKTST